MQRGAIAALFAKALSDFEAGRLPAAEDELRRILAAFPDHVESLHLLGLVAARVGRYEPAAQLLSNAIALKPDVAEAHYHLGLVLARQSQFDKAIACYGRALALAADYVEAHVELGNALLARRELDEAIASYRRALALRPDFAEVHSNLGNALAQRGLPAEAADCHRRALALKPDYADAHSNLGNALRDQGRLDEAAACYRRALAKKPDLPEALNNLGNVLRDLGELDQAIDCFGRALAIRPNFAEAYSNWGTVLFDRDQLDEAEALYRRAIACAPHFAGGHLNLGKLLGARERPEEAVACCRRAVELRPDDVEALSELITWRRKVCDWEGLEADTARLLDAEERRGFGLAPFTLLEITPSLTMQLANARRWAASHFPEVAQRFAHSRPASERPIRIGYLSADFREHAVAHLTAELFERHDRQRFEIFGYSMGPDDANAMRRRIEGGVDHFVDVKDLSNAEAAARIHHDGIDILVDLMGHTGRARTMIAAQRPAPIAVNWLGFPGTMGAAFIDYILVDAVVVPPEHQPFFAEKLVHLPHCYQANDTQRPIGATPTRAECGLPDQAFVFCCFNNEYKLTPRFFAIWMRLLAAVPGSILWLLGTDAMKRNLAREAAARGIDPARLIFAGRQPLEDHLARHRLADLFLDTLPYNAHTTASDALWTGLPVLTLLGEGFPGRVAASLLGAIGLPELVTRSEEDYENMAVKLATEPLMLRGMRERLAANRLTAPLFDSAGFARRIERAYAEMWRRWRAGEAPAAFAVADDGS